jgi:hypothetical protein
MNPSRQADSIPNIIFRKIGTGMATVSVHGQDP